MDIAKIAREIVFIPQKYEQGDKSYYAVVIDTGYFDNPESVTEKDIEQAVREFPKVIKLWLQYSDDQRVYASWYFSERIDSKYAVGFFPDTEGREERIFSDEFIACACYVKRMIERARLLYIKYQDKLK